MTRDNDNIENADKVKENEASKNKNTEKHKEKFCFMCRRSEEAAGKMIDLPIGVPVCNDCMQKAFDSMNNGSLSGIDFNKFNKNVSNFDFQKFGQIFNQGVIKESNKKQEEQEEQEKKPQEQQITEFDLNNLPLPHIIKKGLDEYVVGQYHAKKVISVAVYNHYKRIAAFKEKDKYNTDVEIEKSNILLLGPTGSGKTYLVQILAKMLNVPLALADATSLTEAGYIGDDIESVLSKLLAAAGGDVKRAEHGIVFVDEIDKIAKKKNAHQRDVSGESVQQGMLKLLEGSKVEVPVGASSKNAMVPLTTVDTKNILFICGGAFPGIDDIIKERLNKQSSIGFTAELKDKYDNEADIFKYVIADDLRKYGLIPEFIGRLPIICTLNSLDKDMLIEILKEPKNAILKQYTRLLELDEVELKFSDDALETIADMAVIRKTGARALRAIIEEFMLDIMYEIPKDDNIGKVTITGDYILGKSSPLIEMRTIRKANG